MSDNETKKIFLPVITKEQIEKTRLSGDVFEYFDLFTQPLHEELYKRNSFDFLDELSEGQQLLLSYDYMQNQVLQGGFIQFIENGYIGLLPEMPRWLTNVGAAEMAKVVDNVLKVYVLNKKSFDNVDNVEEFVKLYAELKEFEILDEQFNQLNTPTITLIMQDVDKHTNDFAEIR